MTVPSLAKWIIEPTAIKFARFGAQLEIRIQYKSFKILETIT